MLDGLKPYPAYKESGVPWLGKVPEHWESKAIRRLCRVFAGGTPSRAVPEFWTFGSIPWLSSGDVNRRRLSSARQFITEAGFAASSTKWIRPGSVVMALAGQGRTKGMVATVDFPTTCNQSLATIEPSGGSWDHRFLAYYLESRYPEIRSLVGDGLRDGLNLEHVKSIRAPLPAVAEQSAIVRFLDHAEREIRRYVRAKQQLVTLLEEQKRAAIHQAVTRGLCPAARLRPSGIPWLGFIPEEWEVWQVGHFAQVGNGSTPSRGNSAYWRGGAHPWLNSSTVTRSPIVAATQFVTDIALRECHLPQVMPGSVLVAITGQGKTRGTSAVLQIQATVNQHIAYLTIRREIVSPAFLQLALTGAYRELRAASEDSGSTKGALTCADLRHFRIAVPPKHEQAEILLALESLTRETDESIRGVRHQIDLVRELRNRIVADVVTGRLDVREAAASLPAAAEVDDEPDDSECIEDEPPDDIADVSESSEADV